MSDDKIVAQGVVTRNLGNGYYEVRMDNGHVALGRLSGRMVMRHINVQPQDRCEILLSQYDLRRGIITYRFLDGKDRRKNWTSGRDSRQRAVPSRPVQLDNQERQLLVKLRRQSQRQA